MNLAINQLLKLFRLTIFCTALLFSAPVLSLDTGEEPSFVKNQFLLSFKEGTSKSEILSFDDNYEIFLISEIPHLRLRVYEFVDGRDLATLIDKIKTEPIVKIVEPNFLRRSQSISSDPKFSEQWSLQNTGQTVNGANGNSDFDINWPEAMDIFTGTTPVIVAVVDSGVAFDHPELFLSSALWVNQADLDE